MVILWKRFDVILAILTVIAVSAPWGRSSTRMAEVFCLLLLWAAYFSAAAGTRLFCEWKPAPIRVE